MITPMRLFFMACLYLSGTVYAAGVHVHGQGQLQVALEGAGLDILLTIPAMDMVGFEHQPSSSAHKKAVRSAQQRLQDASAVVLLPAEARCELRSAEVSSELLSSLQNHNHHGHGHGHKEKREHASRNDHGQKEHSHQHNDHPHADFSVSYHYQCDRPDALSLLTLVLLEDFPALSLNAELVSDRGVRSDVLTAAAPRLVLTPGR